MQRQIVRLAGWRCLRAMFGSKRKGQMDMTPFSYYLTQGKGAERPFTGDLYFTKEVGNYHCLTCNQNLFGFEHKFFPNTGMASFWGSHPGALLLQEDDGEAVSLSVNVVESQYKKGATDLSAEELAQNAQLYPQDKQTICCSRCHSHLGLAFKDGPPPSFTRFSINSGAVHFKKKALAPNPLVEKKKRQALQEKKRRQEAQEEKYKPSFSFDAESYFQEHEKKRE